MKKQLLFDSIVARKRIEETMQQYSKAPAWFVNWLDDLYIRLDSAERRSITLDEIVTLQWLYNDEAWLPESLAVNTVYKMFDRLGRDTSGIIGY